MKKSTQQTIKDVAEALKIGIIEGMIRWALISDGWKASKVDQIIRWAKMYVEKTKGQSVPYPDTTVIPTEESK